MLNSYVSVERDMLKLDNVSFREDLLRLNYNGRSGKAETVCYSRKDILRSIILEMYSKHLRIC
jgi:hypothetical protein